ncbi:MAG: alpha/beta hydrolase [Ignavibacteriaceae bacterium]
MEQNQQILTELAIQLSDSSHRKWKHNKDHSVIEFHWEDIKVPGSSDYDFIYEQVSKKYPDYSIQKIKDLAFGIFIYSRLYSDTLVYGLTGKRTVLKRGYVTRMVYITDFAVRADIRWTLQEEQIAGKDIFDEDSEVQEVTWEMLEEIYPIAAHGVYDLSPDEIDDRTGLYEEDSDIEGITEGTPQENSEKYAKPMYEHFDIDLVTEMEALSEKEDTGGEVSLFYGTNRNITGSPDLNNYFGDKLSELKYGKCRVSIPRGHIAGELERPFSFLIIKLKENEKKHIVLKDIIETDEQEFLSNFSEDLNRFYEKSAMIFIHGYNTSFAEAARRAAQIAYDIPFYGNPGFFSWPSCGTLLSYFKDIECADASINYLQEFIEKILLNTNIEKLHLIAHSMGNRIMAVSLTNLLNKSELKEKLKIIRQIILAAPDIDQNVFRNNILPHFINIGEGRTLYSSDKDKALHLSEELRLGLCRLGDAGESLFISPGLDTVDASNVKSSASGHAYIFDTKELLSDLYYLLHKGFNPKDRRLRARSKKGLKYWLFPK